jgi:membrane protein YdbS with pleckstrin-like domain
MEVRIFPGSFAFQTFDLIINFNAQIACPRMKMKMVMMMMMMTMIAVVPQVVEYRCVLYASGNRAVPIEVETDHSNDGSLHSGMVPSSRVREASSSSTDHSNDGD